MLEPDPHGLEGVGDDGALRWAHDVVLAAEEERADADKEDEEGEQVGCGMFFLCESFVWRRGR